MSRKWSEDELAAIIKRSGARLIDRDLKAEPHKVRGALPVARAQTGKARKRAQRATQMAIEPSEHQIQVAVVQWFDLWGPLHGLDRRLLFAVPNAGAGAQSGQAGKMKAEGVRAGCPDLCLALPAPGFHGMFLELKSASGRISPDQTEYHALLRRRDFNVIVAYSAADACRALTVYCESALAGTKAARKAQEPTQAVAGRTQPG